MTRITLDATANDDDDDNNAMTSAGILAPLASSAGVPSAHWRFTFN